MTNDGFTWSRRKEIWKNFKEELFSFNAMQKNLIIRIVNLSDKIIRLKYLSEFNALDNKIPIHIIKVIMPTENLFNPFKKNSCNQNNRLIITHLVNKILKLEIKQTHWKKRN